MNGSDMRMIRRLLGQTQKQFGSNLGVPNPQVQIASMENEMRPISKRLVAAIEIMVDNTKKQQALDRAQIKEDA